ncbi:hypothetical protein GZ77_23915 [Endozoicomonas montiporae]|uniref:BHLH domain-containing protein n=2 Tax=Endozoicomonas montiporae TaxID=1027273 RepID=A0A081MZE9_9GAMM|nr:helix-loop-helix domain-containing protein [Endozoicomonas montiporae]AMO54745.1 hypothetical protein EZMO1_0494 [Endozoicomonas montiporae CL-33]KEQ11572.1 hypothetical protein GZ77_23915 [Endozoicomonas montiporae]
MHASTLSLAAVLAAKAWYHDTANTDLLVFDKKSTGIYWNPPLDLNTDLTEKLPRVPDHNLPGTIPDAKTALVILVQGGGTYSIEIRGDTWEWNQDSLVKDECTLETGETLHKIICTDVPENSFRSFGLYGISNGQLRVSMGGTISLASLAFIPLTTSAGLDNDEHWRKIRQSEFYLKTILQQQRKRIDEIYNIKKKTEDMFTFKPSWMKLHEKLRNESIKIITARDEEAIVISGTDLDKEDNKKILRLRLPKGKPYLIEADIFDENRLKYSGTLPDGLKMITFSGGSESGGSDVEADDSNQLTREEVESIIEQRNRQRKLEIAAQERARQAKIKDAFTVLQQAVHVEGKTSRYNILRAAIEYIAYLTSILEISNEPASANPEVQQTGACYQAEAPRLVADSRRCTNNVKPAPISVPLPPSGEIDHKTSSSDRLPMSAETEMELGLFLQYFGVDHLDGNRLELFVKVLVDMGDALRIGDITEVAEVAENIDGDTINTLVSINMSSDKMRKFFNIDIDRKESDEHAKKTIIAIVQKAEEILEKITKDIEDAEADTE